MRRRTEGSVSKKGKEITSGICSVTQKSQSVRQAERDSQSEQMRHRQTAAAAVSN